MTKDGKITLKVATPAGAYEHIFEVTSKVHEVVEIVVKAKGLVEGDAFELVFDGEPLPDDRPIGSFGFEDGTVLDLIASGSAV
ncbi:MAG: hypothetical protein OXO50_09450 [Caldilineaceae bacterium]|nr:hypothetical protein [Caldilineaceae bacterium]